MPCTTSLWVGSQGASVPCPIFAKSEIVLITKINPSAISTTPVPIRIQFNGSINDQPAWIVRANAMSKPGTMIVTTPGRRMIARRCLKVEVIAVRVLLDQRLLNAAIGVISRRNHQWAHVDHGAGEQDKVADG